MQFNEKKILAEMGVSRYGGNISKWLILQYFPDGSETIQIPLETFEQSCF